MKRYRVTFPDTKSVYDVEAMSRPEALVKGLELLRKDGHEVAEVDKSEQRPGWSKESADGSGYTRSDTTCQVYCLDEPQPSTKFDGQGHPRKVAPGKRHPAPIRGGPAAPPPALPPGHPGKVTGST